MKANHSTDSQAECVIRKGKHSIVKLKRTYAIPRPVKQTNSCHKSNLRLQITSQRKWCPKVVSFSERSMQLDVHSFTFEWRSPETPMITPWTGQKWPIQRNKRTDRLKEYGRRNVCALQCRNSEGRWKRIEKMEPQCKQNLEYVCHSCNRWWEKPQNKH